VSRLVVDDQNHMSECTGAGAQLGQAYAWILYGYLGQNVYGLVLNVKPYRGPGQYSPPVAGIEVHSADAKQVWQSESQDPVSVTIDPGAMTGSIKSTLHNLTTDQPTLQVEGRWSCRP
jgi:hypothetical protein